MHINHFTNSIPEYHLDNQINPLTIELTNKKNSSSFIANQVESLFIQIMLKSMRKTLPKEGLLNSTQTKLYTELYDQAISQKISKKGIGLAKIITQQIENQKLN